MSRKKNNFKSNKTNNRSCSRNAKQDNRQGKDSKVNAKFNQELRKKGSLEDKDDFESSRDSGRNDPAWYARYPQLITDVASIPFSWATGLPFTVNPGANVSGIQQPYNYTDVMPGICVQYLLPSVGYSNSTISNVNAAATAQYSFLTHANSRNQTYDANDCMLYLLAMSQVYSYINFLIRIYNSVSGYSVWNKYMPRYLVNCQGADFDDIYDHMSDFRAGINLMITKAASLCVPATMSVFSRHAFLYQNIYVEGESSKEQLYLYAPRAFWYYDASGATGGHLVATSFFDPSKGILFNTAGSQHKSYDQLLAYGNAMLAPLINDTEIQLMSADILKAYGSNNLIKLSLLPETYTISQPITDLRVLEQMQNATVYGEGTINLATFNIGQDNINVGHLVHTPTFEYEAPSTVISGQGMRHFEQAMSAYGGDKLITTILTTPNPDDIVEITRLSSVLSGLQFGGGSGSTSVVGQINGGSEVVSSCYVLTLPTDITSAEVSGASGSEELAIFSHNYASANVETGVTVAQLQTILYEGLVLNTTSKFKFVPLSDFYGYYLFSTNSASLRQPSAAGNIDNYAVVSRTVLENMHNVALLSELFVPPISLI